MDQRYKNLNEIPNDSREVIQNLLQKGVLDLDNNGQFDLSGDMINIFVILTRLGLI